MCAGLEIITYFCIHHQCEWREKENRLQIDDGIT
jgi:hypothetical protein